MRLRFCIGLALDFETLGIDVSSCRRSIDGAKVMIHQENMTDDQFNAVIDSGLFTFMSNTNPEFTEMIFGPEWSSVEVQ